MYCACKCCSHCLHRKGGMLYIFWCFFRTTSPTWRPGRVAVRCSIRLFCKRVSSNTYSPSAHFFHWVRSRFSSTPNTSLKPSTNYFVTQTCRRSNCKGLTRDVHRQPEPCAMAHRKNPSSIYFEFSHRFWKRKHRCPEDW